MREYLTGRRWNEREKLEERKQKKTAALEKNDAEMRHMSAVCVCV